MQRSTCDDGLSVARAVCMDVIHSLIQATHNLQRERAGAILMLGGGRRLEVPDLFNCLFAAQHCNACSVQLLLQDSHDSVQRGVAKLSQKRLTTSGTAAVRSMFKGLSCKATKAYGRILAKSCV